MCSDVEFKKALIKELRRIGDKLDTIACLLEEKSMKFK